MNRQIKGRQTADLDAAFALRERLLEVGTVRGVRGVGGRWPFLLGEDSGCVFVALPEPFGERIGCLIGQTLLVFRTPSSLPVIHEFSLLPPQKGSCLIFL